MLKVLAKESFVYGLGQAVTVSFGFLTLPFFTRVFDTTDYGVLSLIVSGNALFAVFVSLCLGTAYTRFYHAENENRERLTAVIFWFVFFYGGALTFLVLVGVITALSYFHESYLWLAVCIALISTFLSQISLVFGMVLRMRCKAKYYVIVSIVSTLAGTISSIIFVYADATLVNYFYGSLIGSAVSLIATIKAVKPTLTPYLSEIRTSIGPLLRFSIPLVPAGLSQFLNANMDRWMISYFQNMESVAVYSVAIKFSSVFAIFTSVVMFAFMPHSMKIIESEHSYASTQLDRVLGIVVLCGGIALVVFTMVVSIVLPMLVPKAYSAAVPLVGILAMSHLLFGYTYFSTLGSWKANHSSDYSIAIGVGVVANLFLNFILIPWLGIGGAAIATASSVGITVLVSFWISSKRYNFDFSYVNLIISTAIILNWCLYSYMSLGSHGHITGNLVLAAFLVVFGLLAFLGLPVLILAKKKLKP